MQLRSSSDWMYVDTLGWIYWTQNMPPQTLLNSTIKPGVPTSILTKQTIPY